MTNNITTITSAEFSFFENHRSTQPSTTNIAEVFQQITDANSHLVGKTQSIKTIYNANGGGKQGKKSIAPLKAQLPVVTFGATGNRKDILNPSGLICIDIDELGPKLEEVISYLRSCQFVALLFVSPSGDGLKVVFRIPVISADDQKQVRAHCKNAFKAVAKFIKDQCGVVADPACSDMLRLCYLPHDPEAFLNENSVEFPVNSKLKAAFQSKNLARLKVKKNSNQFRLISFVDCYFPLRLDQHTQIG